MRSPLRVNLPPADSSKRLHVTLWHTLASMPYSCLKPESSDVGHTSTMNDITPVVHRSGQLLARKVCIHTEDASYLAVSGRACRTYHSRCGSLADTPCAGAAIPGSILWRLCKRLPSQCVPYLVQLRAHGYGKVHALHPVDCRPCNAPCVHRNSPSFRLKRLWVLSN